MSSPAVSQHSLLSRWDHARHGGPGGNSHTAAQADNAHDYPEASEHELVAPSDFRPFFTLIEDAHTGQHHHPNVLYIFSDDDPDLLTSTILDATQRYEQGEDDTQRTILVDLQQDGKTIDRCHSLSSDWQVVKATTSQAPSWNETAPGKDGQGLMLKIDGSERETHQALRQTGSDQPEDAIAQMEAVMAGFSERLLSLQVLLDTYSDDGERVADVLS